MSWKKETEGRHDVIYYYLKKVLSFQSFVITEFLKYIKLVLHVFQINKTLMNKNNKENFQLRNGKNMI